MYSGKKIFILFACITLTMLVCLSACTRSSAPAGRTDTNTGVRSEIQNAHGGTTPPSETKYFKGSIGSALGLQMKLVRDGDRLIGSYFYQKVGTRIDLRGTLDKDDNVVLEEFDASGKKTGVFKGIWKTDDGLITIAGNWMKPDSDKKTAFSLHEEPIEFTKGVEIIARQIKEKNKKLKYEIDAEYPQLSGSTDPNFEKFNQTVRSVVTRKVSAFKAGMQPDEASTVEETPAETLGSDISVGYTVALARDDLISIQLEVGSYESGAVHPNSYSEVINFDLKNGRQIKLGDLFKPGSKYVATLAAYCIQDLKKQSRGKGADSMLDDEEWIQKGAGPDSENFSSWTITKKGLGITFDSYQVAPYAAGPQYVLVPYTALKDMIKPDGPIANSLQSPVSSLESKD
jgi:hypothetical protein